MEDCIVQRVRYKVREREESEKHKYYLIENFVL